MMMGSGLLNKLLQRPIDVLSSKRLVELNEEDVEKIGDIFSFFSSKKSIEFTGASKVLHIINPDLFMMWDSKIRNAYHKLHRDKNHEIKQCYIEFLQQSQEIVRELLRSTTESKLWEEHLGFCR